MVIHDLIPTKNRLAKIQRSTTNNCHHCGIVDILIHRLTECVEGGRHLEVDLFQKSDHPSHEPEIYSTGEERPSDFSLLATTEAPDNFVDLLPHFILPYITLAPGNVH